jgi:hypothetical protein
VLPEHVYPYPHVCCRQVSESTAHVASSVFVSVTLESDEVVGFAAWLLPLPPFVVLAVWLPLVVLLVLSLVVALSLLLVVLLSE